jgi:hypothetical protein
MTSTTQSPLCDPHRLPDQASSLRAYQFAWPLEVERIRTVTSDHTTLPIYLDFIRYRRIRKTILREIHGLGDTSTPIRLPSGCGVNGLARHPPYLIALP